MNKKSNFNWHSFAIMVILIFILVTPSVLALATKEEGKKSLVSSRKDISLMLNENFTVVRMKDILTIQKALFDDQEERELKNLSSDYSGVVKKSEEISTLRAQAFYVNDELAILKEVLDKEAKDIDITPAMEVYATAIQEFKDERYERAIDSIDETYVVLTEIQSTSTKLQTLYDVSSKTIANFVKTNWLILLLGIGVISLFFFIFKKKFIVYLTETKIGKLELEKATINKLIKKAQDDYFKKTLIPEGTYILKMKKYKELIRDINREIPLYKEKLVEEKKS